MKSKALLLLFLIVGGLVGSLLGDIAARMAPAGPLHALFSVHNTFGLSPPLHLDLGFLSLSFGLSLTLNLFTVLGFLLGLFFYKRFL